MACPVTYGSHKI